MKYARLTRSFAATAAAFFAIASTGCASTEALPEPGKTIAPAADGMSGKVFAGYQGWYRTPADGSGLLWEHYEAYNILDVDPSVELTEGWEPYNIHGEAFLPGLCGIDFWPDMSEMDEDEKFPTPFDHKDGSTAYVFSSQHPKTVDRHFKWMRDYGIDGIFLQRFAHDVLEGGHHQWELLQPSNNRMAAFVQHGAKEFGRTYAIMYDLSGIRHGEMPMVMDDWRSLCDNLGLLNDPNYLHEDGKPMVAIWGVGFAKGNRQYTLDEVAAFIDFLKNDPQYGGCSVLLGVPTYWRTLKNDAVSDPQLHDVIRSADAILPWTVGRFGGSGTALERGTTYVAKDQAWCDENGVHYLPLAFPGFSWANRYAFRDAKFNHIPREGGRFLWSQAVAAKRAGADTLYVAMFDEMDEGTQIFKVTNNPPVGESRFLTYEPHAPDFYLRLTGAIGRMLRNEIAATETLPEEF